MKKIENQTSLLPFLFVMAVFLFIISFSTISCKKKEDNPVAPDTTKIVAPGFSLLSLSGDTLDLIELKGKVVVLFFFGYTCSHCKESAPVIQTSLVNPYVGRSDYIVLGIDVWNGTETYAGAFKTSTGVTFDLLLNGSATGSAYGTTNDRLVVVDREGYIRFSGQQAAKDDAAAAVSKVNTLLAK